PLASSLPETGRKRTETSTSAKRWSSRRATAHGCVSAVWASTCRPPEARRAHWPATYCHFGLSEPRSYFMVVFSPAARASVVVATSTRAAIPSFMVPSSTRSSSCRHAATTEEFLTFPSGVGGGGNRYSEATMRVLVV